MPESFLYANACIYTKNNKHHFCDNTRRISNSNVEKISFGDFKSLLIKKTD